MGLPIHMVSSLAMILAAMFSLWSVLAKRPVRSFEEVDLPEGACEEKNYQRVRVKIRNYHRVPVKRRNYQRVHTKKRK